MSISGSDIDSYSEKILFVDGNNQRVKMEEDWYSQGFRRRYVNSMYKGKPLDTNLYVKGKEWRKCDLVKADGTIR